MLQLTEREERERERERKVCCVYLALEVWFGCGDNPGVGVNVEGAPVQVRLKWKHDFNNS